MFLVIFCIVACFNSCAVKCDDEEDDGFGGKLIEQLTNDRNLDLPVDEEYEDLRAELLAYHTALANLTSKVLPKSKHHRFRKFNNLRRSMGHTQCWKLGGICILKHLCIGPRYLSEVPGCKDKLMVCCFNWNRYNVRDFDEQGIANIHYKKVPKKFGGKGVISKHMQQKPDKDQKGKVAVIIQEGTDSVSSE